MPLAGQPDLPLIRPGRVHEATGPSRRSFAAALAGRLAGPVLWVLDGRVRETLCPQGLGPFFDPARLVLARPLGWRAVLQATEEALRSGAAPLVVAELAEAPDLTASRRLQLAAGRGGGRGLCLMPRPHSRANAAETRWHCTPLPGPHPRQGWTLTKAKRARPGLWEVAWDASAPPPRSVPSTGGADPDRGPDTVSPAFTQKHAQTAPARGGSSPAPACP